MDHETRLKAEEEMNLRDGRRAREPIAFQEDISSEEPTLQRRKVESMIGGYDEGEEPFNLESFKYFFLLYNLDVH